VSRSADRRLRLVFFGSGAFGLPSVEALAERFDLAVVISQPDREAGRGRACTATPIAAWAAERGIAVEKPADVNAAESVAAIRAVEADAFVVIAYGQKLGVPLLTRANHEPVFAINLHGSLLPAYRGAAPIQWALIDGLTETGVSVIAVAERMDAGLVYARRAIPIDPLVTAGELHDRLAELGPEALVSVLEAWRAGSLVGEVQDEALASKARKLRKDDGRIDPSDADAGRLRARIHGLTPWPGCDVRVGGELVRLLRVADRPWPSEEDADTGRPGTIAADGTIVCRVGRLAVLVLQPHGGRPMDLDQFRRGRRWEGGMRVEPVG
jgi:methionyl-tRNA formyltransferase